MDQGCTNEGDDTRLFGHVVCWLQRSFSYASPNPPRLIGWLPWFGVGVPPYVVIQWKWFRGRYGLFRLGWRYDANEKQYIFPTAAFKLNNKTIMEKGY